MDNARKILLFVGSALGTAFLIAAIAPDSNAAKPSTEQSEQPSEPPAPSTGSPAE